MGEQEKIDQDKITAEEGIVPAEEIDDELVPNNGSDAEDQVVLRIQAELAHVNYLDLLHEYQNTLAEFKDLLERKYTFHPSKPKNKFAYKQRRRISYF